MKFQVPGIEMLLPGTWNLLTRTKELL